MVNIASEGCETIMDGVSRSQATTFKSDTTEKGIGFNDVFKGRRYNFASQAAMACKPSAKRISSQRSAMATPASVWCLPSMVLPLLA